MNNWISIDTNSGDGNTTVVVMVTKNMDTSSRIGSIRFTQDAGGNDIVRTLTVTQEGADLTDLYDLINMGTGLPSDKVTVHSFSKEEVNGVDKFNYAKNSLDKDNETVWAADDGYVVPGDYKGDGEYIIYDLTEIHSIGLIRFSTTNKSDAFGYQVLVSTTGTDDSDFSIILPIAGDLLFTARNTKDFNQYEVVPVEARYVKLLGYGRFNEDGDSRTSVWSAIGEIEFYGNKLVSTEENELANQALLYPIPAQDILHLKNMNHVNFISVYSIDGRKILDKKTSDSKLELDVSSLFNGSYIIVFKGEKTYQSQHFIISR
jgi:poly(beta-D-mannuronate) lyase